MHESKSSTIQVKGGAKSLSSVAGLVMFGTFLRAIGIETVQVYLTNDLYRDADDIA